MTWYLTRITLKEKNHDTLIRSSNKSNRKELDNLCFSSIWCIGQVEELASCLIRRTRAFSFFTSLCYFLYSMHSIATRFSLPFDISPRSNACHFIPLLILSFKHLFSSTTVTSK